ncbi:hypothetical protein ACF073_41025 [Streptomyces sp. NPDC015171]|uniref:hypothetical protein n=1 Tax=Streptomyces sp. NPDC015171 TaxID=3364945 RepID=UPI0037004A39
MALLAGGCSGHSGKGKSKDPGTGVTASEVCDGAFDTSAAEALRRLAGTDTFDESGGSNAAAESPTFSLENAVRQLHDSYEKRSACWVYKSGDDSGEPLLEIRFLASRTHPSSPKKQSGSTSSTYPLGLYARVGPNGADLFFRCPTEAPSRDAFIGDTKYVKGELFSPAGKMRGDNVDKDRMEILNSVSRKVAQTADCVSEAGLPADVPSR